MNVQIAQVLQEIRLDQDICLFRLRMEKWTLLNNKSVKQIKELCYPGHAFTNDF
jgi:hypothetical protein